MLFDTFFGVLRTVCTYCRRRRKLEEKAKVVAVVWEAEFVQFHAAYS